ncbi:DUF4192 domain-containing protein [Streptomyces sp. NPDC000594]|uniref:DUF4192 domain-containing protein n=1 Tax=Streptomyces sp. NPDC000594 TaxID=3154261 RepID=UPI00332511A8
MNNHHGLISGADRPRVTLRGPAELADALPYVLGYHPSDSIVMVALHGSRGAFGGRVRLGIPRAPAEWPAVARQLARCLIEGSAQRGHQPDGVALFLCRDPGAGETGRAVMERLRPLSHALRTACGALDVPVYESLCLSGGRFWSYCCPDPRCCPPEGSPSAVAGTSVMAAAAAYAGVTVSGSPRALEERLMPWTGPGARAQERALDRAAAELIPRILAGEGRARVGEETLALARSVMARLAAASGPSRPSPDPARADAADDALLTQDEAATLILGLQSRTTRDRAAEWMEGPEGEPALRLWRALSRRCVGSYAEHAAAPLTLAGWVAWSTGDQPAARVALGLALSRDPGYVFAVLLHQACNAGLDVEAVRQVLRTERESRAPAPGASGESR